MRFFNKIKGANSFSIDKKNIVLFPSTDYIRRQYTGYLSLRNLVIYSRNVKNMEIIRRMKRTTAQTYFLGLLQTMLPTKNRD